MPVDYDAFYRILEERKVQFFENCKDATQANEYFNLLFELRGFVLAAYDDFSFPPSDEDISAMLDRIEAVVGPAYPQKDTL